MGMMEDSGLCLLCDEEPFVLSPTPPPARASPSSSPPPSMVTSAAVEDRDVILHDLLRREHRYLPCHGYSHQLHRSSYLPAARTRAIQYIILVCNRLNLATGTAFNAVNYLDRFISMNCTVRWEDWMMELLSVACLSIASKMDEVSIPSLHDLQMEELGHSFEARTIQQMELTVLKTLDWRLACITAYTYVEVFTWGLSHVHSPYIPRMIDLLLCALVGTRTSHASRTIITVSAETVRLINLTMFWLVMGIPWPDSRFLRFHQSTVAASALQTLAGSEAAFSLLALPNPVPNMSEVNECQEMMDDLLRRTQFRKQTPTEENGVIP
ncbi:unnamed protein product [Musa hybrid cultivar]